MSADVPVIVLAHVFSLRRRLAEEVGVYWVGITPTGDELQQLSRELIRVLPDGVSRDAVYGSVQHLAGKEITPTIVQSLAWQLAGNVPRLRAGRSAAPWATQREEEWVPVQIVRHDPSRSLKNEYQHKYRMIVLAGTPSGKTIVRYWSGKFLPVGAQHLGFGRYRSPYRYGHPKQFVNLRLMAKLEPRLTTAAGPGFFQIACPQSMVDYNRGILKLRLRVNEMCPREYVQPCHQCMVGFLDCPAGVHRLNYERRFCTHCGLNQVFDPEVEGDRCVVCYDKWLNRKRTE